MNGKTKDKSSDNNKISPFAMDKTYGEKKYDFIFGNLINFWLNLTTSAAFSYWVFHSKSPIKLWGMKDAAKPSEIFESLRGKMEKLPFVQLFKQADTREKISGSMAGTLTLVTMGHLVMIPSVWLGAKIKSSFVRNEDRKHYGDEAMQSDDLKARHAAIDAEERPTFLGAVVGRMGTVLATQTAAYTLGSKINIFRWAGEKTPLTFLAKFHGIDHLVEEIGAETGGIVRKYAKTPVEWVDKQVGKGAGYSAAQLKEHPELIQNGKEVAYGSVKGVGGLPEHYLRYAFADVMYTFVTTLTMSPIINTLKKFIPGLTYKPSVSPETAALAASVPQHTTTSLATAEDDKRAAAKEMANAPSPRVSSISKDETISPRMDQQLTPTTG